MKNNIKYETKICDVKIKNRDLQYTLKRSQRKTIGISIDKSGLNVTCPIHTSQSYITQLLIKKSDWILKKLLYIEGRCDQKDKPKSFNDGEPFYFLGNTYPLKLIKNKTVKKTSVTFDSENISRLQKCPPPLQVADSLRFSGGEHFSCLDETPLMKENFSTTEKFSLNLGVIIVYYSEFDQNKIKKALKLWYVNQFKSLIEQRIRKYADIIGVFPKRIAVREQKTRWGSCSAKGNINLNWKLIMAPVDVLDYVLVHELCHLKELNHSKKYWQLVESIVPQYKVYRKWLKENGDRLSI